MAIAPPPRLEIGLEDKYALEEGTVFMTGVQALVRLPIEQARRDRAAGLRTGTLISGYPGSPLGGYDLALGQARRHLEPLDIHHVPGVNEELAASIVWGTQMVEIFGRPRFDGVTGIWYGKSPGVDRCLDVFKHANLGGGPAGCALLALAGDDPQAKSSTLPNASEWDFIACAMPVLYPASVAEFLELGLHGIALSRLTGLFVAMKAITNLCDGGASVRVGPERPRIVLPELEGFQKPGSFLFLAPGSIEMERHVFEQRLPAAIAHARANRLNRVVRRGPRDRLGIVAAGKTATDVAQALEDLGLDAAAQSALGLRLLKVGMPYPLDPGIVGEFAEGLQEIVVVEEKRDLLEAQLRSILYPLPERPVVVGKRDESGRGLFPFHGELDADLVAERLGPRLLRLGAPASVAARLARIEEIRGRAYPAFARRAPNYCPGCPHSRSTVAVGDEIIGGGVGCHGMAVMMTQEERQAVYNAPMGAEGASWIGAAPFVDSTHFVQNVGDGTFFHSASQSLRACVAAGVSMTFKLLYNRHVSMTGGQDPTGARDLASLTDYLKAEGVARTIVVSERPGDLGGVAVADNARIVDRDRYADAVRELVGVAGVTVLVFDQECAAEKRRARKRGRLPRPEKYVFINEDVCEGCGDCGDVSNCMSVQPVETELGRKTQIHQSSCNQDYSCTRGDCPSFLTVYTAGGLRRRKPPAPIEADRVPEPAARVRPEGAYRVYMPGIGGTGVVTANQVLAYAAMMDGHQVQVLDQTGLAQKGGAVLSSLVIYPGEERPDLSNKVGLGAADLVLGLDPIGVVNPVNADRMAADRTVVVADATMQPTADVIRHVNVLMPGRTALQQAADRFSRAEANVWVDAARTVDAVFGDHMLTNTFLVGVAYQAGLLPLSAESIEAAIQVNGTAVDRNLQAFRAGRLHRHEPEALAAMSADPKPPRARPAGAETQALLDRCSALSEACRRALEIRLPELIAFQDARCAERYVEEILAVHERERQVLPGRDDLTLAAIRNLYKLTAYKDEYEVARLLLKPDWKERLEATFVAPRVRYNLHPPLLRERGLQRKLELGGWFRPALRMLVPMRRLRGTALDPFGRAEVRRVERELVHWYRRLLGELREGLTAENHRLAVQIAAAPDRIRGYEQIKLRNARAVREQVDSKLAEFHSVQVGA